MFLVNSRCGHFSAAPFSSGREVHHIMRAPLLPKLRGQLAEFLNEGSLKRLRILSLPTCVGLRYGHSHCSLRGFSCQCGINQFVGPKARSPSPLRVMTSRICLGHPPTGLDLQFRLQDGLPYCVPPSLITQCKWYRNINLFPIAYAFRPQLRHRLTLGGLTFPRNP